MKGMTEGYIILNTTIPPALPQDDCDYLLDSILVKVIKTVAYSVLLIVSLVGNSLVIAVIWRNCKLRTIINFFILNMAISDLFMPLFAMTTRIKDIYFPPEQWPLDGVFGSITCKIRLFAVELSVGVSVFTLEIIAIERYFSIVFPMARKPVNNRKTCFILIALVWLIAALYPSIYFYKNKLSHRGTTPYCTESWEPAFNNAEALKVENPIFLACFTMIPFILLTSLYSAILVSLHRRKAHHHFASEERRRRTKENRKVTYMLMAVDVVFLVSWTPLNIYFLLSAYVWKSERPCDSRHLVFSAYFFTNMYPAINPMIYYIFNEKYRKGFQELLFCIRRCRLCCRYRHRRLPEAIEHNITYAVESGTSQRVVLLSMRSSEVK